MGSFLRLKRMLPFRWAQASEPYSVFSGVYDHAMGHVDYGEWAEYIVRLLRHSGKRVHTVLEGGCGTGSLMEALSARGYRIAGFDRSLSMIRAARGKVDCPLWLGDLTSAASLRRWDALLCMYDTIQYFESQSLPRLFVRLGEMLQDGGVFVFDVITRKHARADWGNYTEQDAFDGIEFFRHTRFHRRRGLLRTDFTFYLPAEGRLYSERHTQFVYPLSEIRGSAVAGGFSVLGVYDEFTMNPGTENSDRVHFILRKEAH